MNQRNVEALTKTLRDLLGGDCGDESWIAKQLASRGVLAPAALTNGELDKVDDLATEMANTTEAGQKLRAFDMDRWFDAWRLALERIAKGEA